MVSLREVSRLIVQKYGGTSVGTPERIRQVADRIRGERLKNHDLVVVVSAMGHSTDELITLAREVCPASPTLPGREMDMLLTAGERISMALLSMALAERQIAAVSLTGSQSGIITSSEHRRARILRIAGGRDGRPSRIREGLDAEKVVIVAGFQGVSESKEVTTLGRGGSDTTAVALAAALAADVCEIFTDVDGVYSADPRIVQGARLWSRIPASLMLELASRGAGVLHPRCVELCRLHQMNLKVINSFSPHQGGTQVVQDAQVERMEEFKVLGVTHDEGKVPVLVELSRPGAIAALWDAAAALPVVTPQFTGSQVAFFTEKEALPEWSTRLNQLSVEGFVRSFQFLNDWVPLSVVGTQFSQDSGALQKLIEWLAQAEIPVTMGSVSALAATLTVPRGRVVEAVQQLHKRLFIG